LAQKVVWKMIKTPVIPLDFVSGFRGCRGNIFAKLEGCNETKSMKIRSARKILDMANLPQRSVIIESTSGNMGVALAAEASRRKLDCKLVVDPKLSPWHRKEMNAYGVYPHDVYVKDDTDGWLKTRLNVVKEYLDGHPDWYWVNQYENPWNPLAFEELGAEIMEQLKEEIDKALGVHLFMAVSTGGSLTGVARYMNTHLPAEKDFVVYAVDAKGSAIFGPPGKRYLNGIGSSLCNPPNLNRRLIDHAILVDDRTAFKMCWELRKTGPYVGGSSGAVAAAIKTKISAFKKDDLVIGVFPDAGDIYTDTLYNVSWLKERDFNVMEMICAG